MPIVHRFLFRFLLPLLAACCLLTACGSEAQKKEEVAASLSGYDMRKPYVLKLPLQLDEISGLAYVPSDNTLLAVNDETGLLFKINLKQIQQIQQWNFGPPGDHEGVAVADSFVYILRSDGTIFQIYFKNKDTIITRDYPFPQTGNEFESLTYLPAAHSLLLICKNCVDDAKEEFSWFRFDLDSMRFSEQWYRFPVQKIEEVQNYKRKRFKPSGVALHPKTGNYYVISAVNKALVVISPQMEVLEVAELEGPAFAQPEGIDFDTAGNMFISNETDKVQAANLLIFPYHATP